MTMYARAFSWPLSALRVIYRRLRLALQALQRRGRSRHIAASTLSQLGNKIRSRMSFTAKSRFTVALRFSMLSVRKENCIFLLHVKRA